MKFPPDGRGDPFSGSPLGVQGALSRQSPRQGTWGCPLHSQAEQSPGSQDWAGFTSGTGTRLGAGVGTVWLLGVYLELGDHGCTSGLTPVSCSAASPARADSSPTSYLCLPPSAPLPPSFHGLDNSPFTSPFCFFCCLQVKYP